MQVPANKDMQSLDAFGESSLTWVKTLTAVLALFGLYHVFIEGEGVKKKKRSEETSTRRFR